VPFAAPAEGTEAFSALAGVSERLDAEFLATITSDSSFALTASLEVFRLVYRSRGFRPDIRLVFEAFDLGYC
jgi:hypothetical protein